MCRFDIIRNWKIISLFCLAIGDMVISGCDEKGIEPSEVVTENPPPPPPPGCDLEDLYGKYLFWTGTDTCDQPIIVFEDTAGGFRTTGIDGYDFWFPAARLSGQFTGCDILVTQYTNVMHQGLPTPGGYPRFYYDSMSGQGQIFPEQDSFVLHILFTRKENWPVYFNGTIHFKKMG